MSIEMPAYGFDEVMVRLIRHKEAIKLGWKPDLNGRMGCIIKDFDMIRVTTIGAGNVLLFRATDLNSPDRYMPMDAPEIKQAIQELTPIIERLINRHKNEFKKGFEWANKEGGYHLTPSKYGF
jgi:hypothetical protein